MEFERRTSMTERPPDRLMRCTFGCMEYQNVETDNPFANCPRCGMPMETKGFKGQKLHLATSQVLEQPGVARLCDITIDYIKSFEIACQGLEKIATGRNGKRDTAATAQIMREIAIETLAAVRYGAHGQR